MEPSISGASQPRRQQRRITVLQLAEGAAPGRRAQLPSCQAEDVKIVISVGTAAGHA
jgi:hypothetical protein